MYREDLQDQWETCNAMGLKQVYKIKYKENREVGRFKERQVAKGYSQQEGHDHYDTFLTLTKIVIVTCVIACVVSKGWCVHQTQVYNVFPQEDLDEKVYME